MFFDKIFDGNVEHVKQQKREARKLEAALRFEEQRKERIFNGKTRLFGVDCLALEEQIAEKDKERQIAKECENKYVKALQQNAGAMLHREMEEERQRRQARVELDTFRRCCQRPELRDSFELNDPDLLKKSLPARIADDDIGLSLGSAQVFQGEDLGRTDRLRLQKIQTNNWLERQMQDEKNNKHAEKMAKLIVSSSMCSRDRRLKDMEEAENKRRQRERYDLQEFNASLARKKQYEREAEKREELADNLAEIYNMITSDMLSENTENGRSETNPNKKLVLSYRGMTPYELDQFRQAQHRQLLEERRRKFNDKVTDFQWYHYELNLKRLQGLKVAEQEKLQREKRDECVRFNLGMAEHKRAEKERQHRNRDTAISDDFYKQFNRSTR